MVVKSKGNISGDAVGLLVKYKARVIDRVPVRKMKVVYSFRNHKTD